MFHVHGVKTSNTNDKKIHHKNEIMEYKCKNIEHKREIFNIKMKI